MESSAKASRLLSSLAALALACTAAAQHGGAPHAGPAMPAPRGGGFAPGSHTGIGPAPASRGMGYGAGRSLFPPPGITSTRPVYYSNGIAHYGSPDRRGTRYGYNGGPMGVLSLGSPGYLDFGYDPDFLNPTYNPNTVGEGSGLLPDAVINPQPPSMGAYGGGYPAYGTAGYPEPGYGEPVNGAEPVYPREQATNSAPENDQAPVPTPFLAAPARRASAPSPAPLPEEEAVTIIFKDGAHPSRFATTPSPAPRSISPRRASAPSP